MTCTGTWGEGGGAWSTNGYLTKGHTSYVDVCWCHVKLCRDDCLYLPAYTTHQSMDDPEGCVLHWGGLSVHVCLQDMGEILQASRWQAVTTLSTIQLDQQGQTLDRLFPHLLVFTGQLQRKKVSEVNHLFLFNSSYSDFHHGLEKVI